MLFASGILYLVIGWYLEQVLPSRLGVQKPLLFFLSPKYWQCNKRRVPGSDRLQDSLIDHDDAAGKVTLQGLGKTYGDFRAVSNMDVTMNEGEIFALLGHNGAGKTTTISMLTGLTPPTEGNAKVYGYRISDEMAPIHKLLGLCPQHDILFDLLTTGEHIDFFTQLKGGSEMEVDRQRNEILQAFELADKEDHFVYGLSGGMKRKLCVAIALAGDARFVVLDEPTAGLDPAARRRLWQALIGLKTVPVKRTILLTTHYMDEAEALGDRIAIMKDGQIARDQHGNVALGSATELKLQYECGYSLTVRQVGPTKSTRLTRLSANSPGGLIDRSNLWPNLGRSCWTASFGTRSQNPNEITTMP